MKHTCKWACLLAFVSAVSVQTVAAIALPQVNIGAEGQNLQQWLLLGPFAAKGGGAAEDVDFLSPLGCPETGYGRPAFMRLISVIGETKRQDALGVRMTDKSDTISFNQIYADNPESELPQTAVYAACELRAESDGEAWLMLGSDDGAKAWLNGALLNAVGGTRGLAKYDDCVRLRVKAGVNLLVIKVSNVEGTWAMAARLEPNINSAAKTAWSLSNSIVKHVMVPEGGRLELAVRGLPDPIRLALEIKDHKGRLVKTVQSGNNKTISLEGLPPGLYHVQVDDGAGHSRDTALAIGGLEILRKQLNAQSQPYLHDDRTAININTLLRRLEILDHPFVPRATDKPWTRDVYNSRKDAQAIFLVAELTDVLDRLAANEEPFDHRPGLHFRGFRSVVDDQAFHYRLFVPSNYRPDSAGLPLIICMQTVFANGRPNIESVYFANYPETREHCELAEKLGVGLLWPGYRNRPYGNPIDDAYLDEVLETVARDYKLDTQRLYLYGSCSGGMTASMEVLRNPRRYAALAYINPVLHRQKHRFDEEGEYAGNPTYRRYLAASDPVEPLAALPKKPIWIIHDGVDPDHGPLAHSVDFVELARALGQKPIFERSSGISNEMHIYNMERQFKWLLEQRLAAPQPLVFAPPPTDGPISRVFAERFIVVRGTLGNGTDKNASNQWCQAFLDAWMLENYGPCRVINDIELTEKEERASNLILIGNGETNAVWQRLAGKLPINLSKTGVAVGNKHWEGANLAIEAWASHPQFPGRRIAFIGAADLDAASIGTMELEVDGWFDYAIWRKIDSKAELVAAERYAP